MCKGAVLPCPGDGHYVVIVGFLTLCGFWYKKAVFIVALDFVCFERHAGQRKVPGENICVDS